MATRIRTSIEPVTKADLPATHNVLMRAFQGHPRMPMMWPRGHTEDLYAFKFSRDVEGLSDPTCAMFKAVDTSNGQIVGAAEWAVMDLEAVRAKQPTNDDAQAPADWPMEGNWAMRRFYTINLEKLIKRHLPDQGYIELHLLMVLPELQRKGVGADLLAWGLAEADRRHVAMCLEATPDGLALYKKHGFKEVELIDADMREFGWMQPYDRTAAVRVFMIRDAR